MSDRISLYQHLISLAQQSGTKSAITEVDSGNSITYSELVRIINAFNHLIGSQSQTILAALPGGIIDSVVFILSLIAGHTIIPVSPDITEHELKQLFEIHPITVVISSDHIISPESVIHITTKELDDLRFHQTSHAPYTFDFEEVTGYLLLYTSGSTGKPKGIRLAADQIFYTASHIVLSHGLTSDDVGLTPLPFFHINAPVVSLFSTMLSGGHVVIAPKFSLSQFWEWVERYQPTWISLVPTIITLLLKTDRPDFLNSALLRFIRTASAPLSPVTLTKFEDQFRIPLIETYGISEAASTITANPVPPGVRKPGSVGLPIGVSLCIADTQRPGSFLRLPMGQHGEICVKGRNVINSYEDEKGDDAFNNGWFCTGDLGYIDSDGYVFITGRKKDVINRGGEIIAPREIEDVLLQYPGIEHAVAVGHPDEILGEKVVAVVTAENVIDEQKVIDFAATKLSPPKVPSRIITLKEFPKGRTGKIDRNYLKNPMNFTDMNS